MKYIKSFQIFEANNLNNPEVKKFISEMPLLQKSFIDLEDQAFINLIYKLENSTYKKRFYSKVSKYKSFNDLKNAMAVFLNEFGNFNLNELLNDNNVKNIKSDNNVAVIQVLSNDVLKKYFPMCLWDIKEARYWDQYILYYDFFILINLNKPETDSTRFIIYRKDKKGNILDGLDSN